MPIKKKIFTLMLVIMPIVNQYAISTLFFMDFIALIGIFLFFLQGHHSIKANYAMIIYVMYIIIDTALYSSYLNGIPTMTVVIRTFRVIILYFFFYFISSEYFDTVFAFKVYTKIVYTATIVIIVQIFWYYITGNVINILIPEVPINYGNFETSSDLMHSWSVNASIGYYRPCSFFLEPAMQAQYVLPWLAISLVMKRDILGKNNMLKMILVTLGICCTTSSLGILCAAVLWLVNCCVDISKKDKDVNSKRMLAVPFLLICLLLITNMGIVNVDIFGKLSKITDDTGGSTTWRLIRGAYCFNDMPFINKIIGCGYGNISTFFTQYGITTIYDKNLTVNSYMNAGFTLICSLGLIGFVLYMLAMRKTLFLNMNYMKFSLLICFVILVFTSSIFDSGIYFLIVLFLQQVNHLNSIDVNRRN